jgi:hypothetical protein
VLIFFCEKLKHFFVNLSVKVVKNAPCHSERSEDFSSLRRFNKLSMTTGNEVELRTAVAGMSLK